MSNNLIGNYKLDIDLCVHVQLESRGESEKDLSASLIIYTWNFFAFTHRNDVARKFRDTVAVAFIINTPSPYWLNMNSIIFVSQEFLVCSSDGENLFRILGIFGHLSFIADTEIMWD